MSTFITSRGTAKINWELMRSNIFSHPAARRLYRKVDTIEEFTKAACHCTGAFLEDLRLLSIYLVPQGTFPKVYYLGEDTDDVLCVGFLPGFLQLKFWVLDGEYAQGDLTKAPEKEGWQLVYQGRE